MASRTTGLHLWLKSKSESPCKCQDKCLFYVNLRRLQLLPRTNQGIIQIDEEVKVTQTAFIKEVTAQHLESSYTCFARNSYENRSVTIRLKNRNTGTLTLFLFCFVYKSLLHNREILETMLQIWILMEKRRFYKLNFKMLYFVNGTVTLEFICGLLPTVIVDGHAISLMSTCINSGKKLKSWADC